MIRTGPFFTDPNTRDGVEPKEYFEPILLPPTRRPVVPGVGFGIHVESHNLPAD